MEAMQNGNNMKLPLLILFISYFFLWLPVVFVVVTPLSGTKGGRSRHGCTGDVLLAQILDSLEESRRFHKRPRFPSSASMNFLSQLTPPPIIYNLLTCEPGDMSLSFSHNINSLNSYTTVHVSNNFPVEDDRSQILAWFSPLDPKSRHKDIQGRRVENIGEWLLQTQEFRSWHAGNGTGGTGDAVLFCYGNPGVGKTYIR